VWLLVAAITILFAAFTSTYLVRRNAGEWPGVLLPPVLWLTTAVLLISSVTIEAARRVARRGTMAQLRGWLAVTTVLGLGFLAGQLVAWRQLAASGVFMATNPHSAFFYLLTGAHGLHLAGGIGALAFALTKAPAAPTAAAALDVVDPVATYWHFLDGLWLYLFLILYGI
jgi:cytochrome c oxidase subunit 3